MAGGAPGFTDLDEVQFDSDGTCRERFSGRLSPYVNRGVWSLVSMPSPDGEGHFLSVVRSSSDVQLTELVIGRLFQYVDRGL